MIQKPFIKGIVPRMSVIIPVFNGEKYLVQTLDSLVAQTCPDFEVIIVDGASTDRTLEIISNYSKLVTTLISEPDNGMYYAVNKGLKLAKGEILAYLNSDDMYKPNAVNTVLNNFSKKSTYNVIYGNLEFIDNTNKRIKKIIYPKILLPLMKAAAFSMVGQPSVFWRKEVHNKVGYFNTNYRYAADQEFFSRLASQYKFVKFNEEIAKFRIHENTLTYRNAKLSKAESHCISKCYYSNSFLRLTLTFLANIYFKIHNL